jgi:glycosyltransferase involved in cell wall biosynthesis
VGCAFALAKGQRPFLEAAARVARLHPHTRFVLAGRGTPEQTQALREYAENAGLPRENLILLGVVDNLPDIMAAFDIGVALRSVPRPQPRPSNTWPPLCLLSPPAWEAFRNF